MTAKDFIVVADSVSASYWALKNREHRITLDPAAYENVYGLWYDTVYTPMADALENEYPRFDRLRFANYVATRVSGVLI